MLRLPLLMILALFALGGAALAGTHALPGFSETLLALAGEAPCKMTVLHVGDGFSRHDVDLQIPDRPVAVRSAGKRFHVLFRGGTLLVIDAAAHVVARHNVGRSGAADLEVLPGAKPEACVCFEDAATVRRLDLTTGARIADIEGAPESAKPRGCQRMLADGSRLYVTIGLGAHFSPTGSELAVVDLAKNAVLERVDLACKGPDGRPFVPLNPGLPLVLDAPRHLLYVCAAGNRPVDPGGVVRLALDRPKLTSEYEAGRGAFQGTRVLSLPLKKMLEVVHTSTPVASTHLSQSLLQDDGTTIAVQEPPLLDLFEETNQLSLNAAGTLAMIPNTCATGICLVGKGINFIDVASGKLLPKLTDAMLDGFAPTMAAFLRD